MPGIHSGLTTALSAFAFTADEKTTAVLMDRKNDYEACGMKLAQHPIAAHDEVWVELMSTVHMSPLLGPIPGSHVLCGCAINPQRALTVPVFDMFLFIAVVDAGSSGNAFTLGQVKSLSASPLQVRLSHAACGMSSIFQYKKIGHVRTRTLERQLMQRDLTFHKLAIKFLCESDRIQNGMVAALKGLPDWLREPTL